MIAKDIVIHQFQKHFSQKPEILVNAPGRINLIGEHTDYNDGFVMPAAIDKSILLAGGKNNVQKVRFFSVDFNQSFEIEFNKIEKTPLLWPDYLLGVLEQLTKLNLSFGGIDVVFGGDIPIGAGLSSSAALETGFALLVSELYNLRIDNISRTKLSQAAENQFVGVNCGIMDQFASVFGKDRHFVRLDCRTLEYDYAPFETDDYTILLFDTQVKHSLASSAYNTRRQECETAVSLLQNEQFKISALRDVNPQTIYNYHQQWDSNVYNRARFVTEENQRVLTASQLLKNNDFVGLGQLMFDTHHGLSTLYKVSCNELDFLANLAIENSHVIGARMMGGGFGGCTINLVKKGTENTVIEQFKKAYFHKFKVQAKHYGVNITDGTAVL